LVFKFYKELYQLLMYLLFICQKGRIRRAKKFRIWPQDSDPTADSFYHSRDPAQDLEQLREFDALFAEKGYCEETVRAARPNCLNMIVVKLNSGGLLLYCPVQVHVHPTFLFPCKESYVFIQTKV